MSKKRFVLITGATSGIGLETAKELIAKGYYIIGTSRSDDKERKAKKILGKNAEFISCDMSSQKKIRRLAEETQRIIEDNGLDVLINNAGTFFSYYALSGEGVEMQFAVNAVAPLYLSLLLYDEIKRAKGRIINVTSSSHYNTSIKWSDIQLSKNYSQLKAYKQTKLFSIMLSREFNKRSKSAKTYMADPGLVSTDIGFKNTGALAKLVWKYRKSIGQTTSEGASTSVFLASIEDLTDDFYWKYCKPKKPSKKALDDKNSERIWDYCKGIVDVDAEKILR